MFTESVRLARWKLIDKKQAKSVGASGDAAILHVRITDTVSAYLEQANTWELAKQLLPQSRSGKSKIAKISKRAIGHGGVQQPNQKAEGLPKSKTTKCPPLRVALRRRPYICGGALYQFRGRSGLLELRLAGALLIVNASAYRTSTRAGPSTFCSGIVGI